MLSGVTEADGHAEHEHAEVDFYLPTQYRLAGAGEFLTGPAAGDPFQIASDYLVSHAAELGLSASDLVSFVVSSQYTDQPSGITHIYLQQTHDGLEVMNADLSINVTARGEIINVSSTFISDPEVADSLTPQFLIGAPQAFAEFSDDMGLGLLSTPQIVSIDSESPDLETVLAASGVALEDVQAKLVYVPTADGLELAWRLNVQTLDQAHWYDAFVDADSGESIYTDDWVGHASYRVFASPLESPDDGPRTLVTDPHDTTASPFGWHDTNGVAGAEFTDVRGNNATVQEDGDANNTGGTRPDGGAGLNFDFPLDVTQPAANYQSAAMTNLFYWVNLLHDIHYQYGFTEAAGNFQVNNYGNGGLGNDPVLADLQDGDGGGPSFFTPPDGQSPRMQMYIRASSGRDSAIDSHLIIHEYGHGISERLTGGPANNQGLNATQSRGMGEGWGDWWAIMLTQKSTDTKLDAVPIGAYYFNLPGGGRRYPYSFDMAINPLTYADYKNASTRSSQHAIGEIWASALWDMNWLLVEKHGFSSDLSHGTGGNNLALQLVMDALKLQGTNPSLLDGRDAILAADLALTGGQNQAEIWTAFARRGMGLSASDGGGSSSTSVTEAFDIPGAISGTIYRDDDADGTRDAGEPGLSGWSVYRDLNNNGVQDVASVTTRNSTDTPKATVSPFMTSNLVVSGLSGVVVDLNVTVNITHQAVGELVLTLISPNSAVPPISLGQYLGGSNANYTNTTFDDEAAIPITSASAPFTGTFRSYSSLAQADGISPNGTWKLRIDDLSGGFSGTLVDWAMAISYGNPDPTTVTDANGNYVLLGAGNGTHHVRELVQPGFAQTAPASGVNDVVISGSQPVSNQNFGNRAAASVSNTSTLEDTLSSAIVISPPAGFGATYFKISGITNGTLFQNDGTTPINNGDFITVAEGQAGVKFLPSANSNATGSFTVELSQDGTTVSAITSPTTCTITVSPSAQPTLSINNVNISEGNSGTSLATFTVTLSAASGKSVMIDYATADGTALAASDYATASGTLTLAAGVTSKTFTIPILGDVLDEPNETFVVNLSNAINASIDDGQGVGTILDNDAVPSLSINDVTVLEGSSGETAATFTVKLSAVSGQSVTVNYATANSGVISAADYAAKSGTLTFAAGEATRTITVQVTGDSLDEVNEYFFMNLSSAVNATIFDSQGLGIITDDDDAPSLSIGDVTVSEGSSGLTTATFTVSLSAASGRAVTVQYGTANSTAVASADYTAISGTLSFPAGTTTKLTSVAVKPDLLDELDETFFVNLLNATNASIADNRATGTITDDDAPPTMSIKDVVVYEGNSGQALATFSVSLSAASGRAVSVNYSTTDGTALAGADYATTSGTLILAAGTTSKSFTVPFYGDVMDETNETFFVNLANAINASLVDNQALATITDNDAAPSLTINDIAVVEGNSGSANVTFTVTLSAVSGQAVSVKFATANGTALAGSDYEAQSGTLIFAPGEKTKTVAIAVTGDTLDEANENYFVKLSGATNASIADSSGTGTITDNDAAPTLSINDVTILEGHSGLTTATFTVTLSAASGQTVSVKYATASNSATASADYTTTSGTLTFAAGVISKTITVSIKGDVLNELDEFFFVNLSSPINATLADSQGRGTITDDD